MLLVIFPFNVILSQFLPFDPIANLNDLRSSLIYKIIEDSKGQIWFATDNGVSSYDGNILKEYKVIDGLTDYEVLSVYEDSEHRIWLRTFNGIPCYIKDRKIYNSKNDPLLSKISLGNNINYIQEDNQKNIWLGSSNITIKLDYKEQSIDTFNIASTLIYENQKKEVILFNSRFEFYNTTEKRFKQKKQNYQEYLINRSGINTHKVLPSQNIIFSKSKELYLLNTSTNQVKRINVDISELNESYFFNFDINKDGNILMASSKGAYVLSLNEKTLKLSLVKKYFEKENILSFLIDYQGGIWASKTTGIHYSYEDLGKLILKTDHPVIDFKLLKDDLIITAQLNNKISVHNLSQQKEVLKFETETKPQLIRSINDALIIIANNLTYLISDINSPPKIIKLSFKDFNTYNNQYAICMPAGTVVVNKNNLDSEMRFDSTLTKDVGQKIYERRSFKFIEDNSKLYFSAIDGIYEIKSAQDVYSELFLNFNYRANSMLHDSTSNTTIVGASGNGLLIYKDKILVKHFTTNNGLLSNYINNIFRYQDKTYIVSKKAIHVLEEDFTLSNFLSLSKVSDNIYSSVLKDNNIYLATTRGVIMYDLNGRYNKKLDLKANITIRKNENIINKFETIDYSNDPVTINYQVFNYTGNSTELYHRLFPLQEEWQVSNSFVVPYHRLDPGKYTFELKANETIISNHTFKVDEPLWKNSYFRIASFLSVFLILWLVLRNYYLFLLSKKEANFKLQIRIANAEQNAIIAQMNPHFIFNCLNSIQNLVLDNNADRAYDYLGQFSKLVRVVLSNSRALRISIKDEINFLKLYLNLEKLRFDSKFEYNISYEGINNLQQKIPSMVIQPFVENAIIHGLIPIKKSNPELNINLTETEQFVFINIIDNGIGFDNPALKNKYSLGLKLIKERLDLYDHTGKSFYKINSLDVGTFVKLQINKHAESVDS